MKDDVILISTGTAAAAVLFEIERKRSAEIRRLVSRLENSGNTEAIAIEDRIDELRDSVQSLALDVDANTNYELNPPLDDTKPAWPIGTFLHCTLPAPDLAERIREGRHPGRFEHLNTEALDALSGQPNASGALRPNGWLAMEVNRTRIEREIQRCYQAITQRRRTFARAQKSRVRVVVIAGSFGGFGSGSLHSLRSIIAATARAMQLDVDLATFLMLPGATPPKDPVTTGAITFGLLMEVGARATGSHWEREPDSTRTRRIIHRAIDFPTILVSDTANSSGEPRATSPSNFAGAVAELIRAYAMTDLGATLEARAADFGALAIESTPDGEPRCGRAINLSVIHLDRERLYRFALANVAERMLSKSLQTVREDIVHRDVRAFLESRRVVQGRRLRQLSDRLLERRDGRHVVSDIERFRGLFRASTAGLSGLALLEHAQQHLQVALLHLGAGNLEGALAKRSDELLQLISAEVKQRFDDLVRDRRAGIAAAKQSAEEFINIIEHMHAEAARDTAHWEQRLADQQGRVQHYQAVYLPALQRKSVTYRLIKRSFIKTHAEEYRRALEELEATRMDRVAHNHAIAFLKNLLGILKEFLARIQMAVDTVAAERDGARAEKERMIVHRPDYGCPIGLALVSDGEDLEAFYQRILPDRGDEQVEGDVHARLLDVPAPLELTSDPAAFHDAIMKAIAPSFRERVDALHVGEELQRRFPDRSQLGSVLRERVRESFEALQLQPRSEQEDGLHMVRLLGIDTNRMGRIPEVLAEFDINRGIFFQVVHVDDPERIYFLQYRAVFPISAWSRFPTARRAYEDGSNGLCFERFHVSATDRSLPVPGEPINDRQARVITLKAWLIERLDHRGHDGKWHLHFADAVPLELGADLQALRGRDAYRRAVDVLTHFACEYRAHGGRSIREKLAVLRALRAGRNRRAGTAERNLTDLIDDEAINLVEIEIEWWERNTVPAAMSWDAGPSSNATPRRVGKRSDSREPVP